MLPADRAVVVEVAVAVAAVAVAAEAGIEVVEGGVAMLGEIRKTVIAATLSAVVAAAGVTAVGAAAAGEGTAVVAAAAGEGIAVAAGRAPRAVGETVAVEVGVAAAAPMGAVADSEEADSAVTEEVGMGTSVRKRRSKSYFSLPSTQLASISITTTTFL